MEYCSLLLTAAFCHSLDPRIKPPHSLEIPAFLRKRLLRISQVRSDRKAMLSV